MRMAELSRSSGVATATIKYYLREGLLSPGEATAHNQAQYDRSHLERLELIRALRDVAGLPIATIRRVFDAMGTYTDGATPTFLSTAVGALSEPFEVPADDAAPYDAAAAEVAELIEIIGWNVDADSPGYADLIRALVAVHRYLPGLVADAGSLRPYADAAATLAEFEVPDGYDPGADPSAVLRFSVLGTVLFEPVLLALRKLAHANRIRHLAQAR